MSKELNKWKRVYDISICVLLVTLLVAIYKHNDPIVIMFLLPYILGVLTAIVIRFRGYKTFGLSIFAGFLLFFGSYISWNDVNIWMEFNWPYSYSITDMYLLLSVASILYLTIGCVAMNKIERISLKEVEAEDDKKKNSKRLIIINIIILILLILFYNNPFSSHLSIILAPIILYIIHRSDNESKKINVASIIVITLVTLLVILWHLTAFSTVIMYDP